MRVLVQPVVPGMRPLVCNPGVPFVLLPARGPPGWAALPVPPGHQRRPPELRARTDNACTFSRNPSMMDLATLLYPRSLLPR